MEKDNKHIMAPNALFYFTLKKKQTKNLMENTEVADLASSPTLWTPVSAPQAWHIPSPKPGGTWQEQGTHIPVGTVNAPTASDSVLQSPGLYKEQSPAPPHASYTLCPLRTAFLHFLNSPLPSQGLAWQLPSGM